MGNLEKTIEEQNRKRELVSGYIKSKQEEKREQETYEKDYQDYLALAYADKHNDVVTKYIWHKSKTGEDVEYGSLREIKALLYPDDYVIEKTIIYDELGIPYVNSRTTYYNFRSKTISSEVTTLEGFFDNADGYLTYMKACENHIDACNEYSILSKKTDGTFELMNGSDVGTVYFKLYNSYLNHFRTTLTNLGFDSEDVKQ